MLSVNNWRTMRPWPAPRAERTAISRPARCAASEQQVRHVPARDQQHHADRGEQHEQPCLVVADEAVSERRRRISQLAGVLRKIMTEAHGHGFELLLRLLHRRAGLQSPVHFEVMLVVQNFLVGCKGDRGPELFAVGGEIERLRHDARDGVGRAVHAGRAADQRGAGAEPAGPQPMAQHDDAVVARLIFLGREHPAQQRPHAHHLEVVRGDARADDALGRGAVSEVEAREALRRHAFEGGDAGRGIGVVADGHFRRQALERFGDDHQPRRIAQRQRLQHDGVDRTEDSGRAANAEREREDGDRREAWILEELAPREGDVLAQLAEVLGPLHLPVPSCAEGAKRRPEPPDVAESPLGLQPGRGRIHPAVDVFAGSHLEMKRDLFLDFVVDPRAPGDAVEETQCSTFNGQGSGGQQHARDGGREARPLGGLRRQVPPAARRQPVELGPAAQFRQAPFGLDPSLLFHAVEGGVERSLFDFDDAIGRLFDGAGDGVAVAPSAGQGLEDQGVQGAVQELGRGIRHSCHQCLDSQGMGLDDGRGAKVCEGVCRGHLCSFFR
jgi:hypothetical protein